MYVECVVIYDKDMDIANKESKKEIFTSGSLRFWQRVILVSYEIVLCIFKYELHIQRLNVNSRVSRIEDQKWKEVECIFNIFMSWRFDRLKANIMNLKCVWKVTT